MSEEATYGLENWPPMLRAIAKSIGVEGALLLSQQLGGLEYYIPRSVAGGHTILKMLGPERFAHLVRDHGGQRIAIPRDAHANMAKAKIITLLEAGWHPKRVARECQVTQRYVRRVSELIGVEPSKSREVDSRQLGFNF